MPLVNKTAQQILRERIDALEGIGLDMTGQIIELEKAKHDNEVQMKILEDVLTELAQMGGGESVSVDAIAINDLESIKPTATQAIRRLLSKRPSGMTQAEIIEELKDGFATKSQNPVHILRTCLHQLKATKKIAEDETGRFKFVSSMNWGDES